MAAFLLQGSITGQSTLTAVIASTYLVGGQVRGYGNLEYQPLKDLEGLVTGQGSTSTTVLVLGGIRGAVGGTGNLCESLPMPIRGVGNTTAYIEVGPVLPSICTPDTRQTFSFMATLQPGGLSLEFCDAANNPYQPTNVTYALYEVLPGGYRQLRGPARRTPSFLGTGQYSAVGLIGECGQPGTWVIVWSWMSGSECHSMEEEFVVTAGPPLTNVCGCKKYGWD